MLIFLIVSCDTLIPDDLNINPNSPSEAPEDLVLTGSMVGTILFMKEQLQEELVFGLDILEELIDSMKVLTIILLRLVILLLYGMIFS